MLMLLIFTTVTVVRGDVALATSQKQAFYARCLAEKGIAIAANPTTKKSDKLLLHFDDPEIGGHCDAQIKGEGGRFNINNLVQGAKAIDPTSGESSLLTILLAAMGMTDNRERQLTIANLVNWQDADDLVDLDPASWEKEQYEKEGLLNYPFNRPFYSLDEVLLVKGMEKIPGLFPQWRDIFTVFSSGKVDVNEAAPLVIALAAIKDEKEAEQWFNEDPDKKRYVKEATDVIQKTKWGQDGEEDTTDDQKLTVEQVVGELGADGQTVSARLSAGDTTTRIESTATVGDYRKRIVLVLRNRTNNPQILHREEVPLFEH